MRRQLALIALSTVLALACRKPKTSVLHLIRPDAPVVAWSPSPEQGLADLDGFLRIFDGESLGDQIKALRADLAHQLGFDPTNAKALRQLGLDPSKPWAVATDPSLSGLVWIIAADDPSAFLEHFRGFARDNAGASKEDKLGSDDHLEHTFGQPFGDVVLETFAVRLAPKAVLITSGAGANQRLLNWPTTDELDNLPGTFKNFGQLWKKAESDGSAAGAAVRLFVQNVPATMPADVAGLVGPGVQLRGALTFLPHKLDLFATALGLKATAIRQITAPAGKHAAAVGLPDDSVVVMRSELVPSVLLKLLRRFGPLTPVLSLIDREAGPGQLDEALALATGEGWLALELANPLVLPSQAKSPIERLNAALDLVPVTALAELKTPATFDAWLGRLLAFLNRRGLAATLSNEESGPILRSASLSGQSEVVLSRRGSTLVYGVGKESYTRALTRLEKNTGIAASDPAFSPLLAPETSGIVIDLARAMPLIKKLPETLFGGQNQLVRSLLGQTLRSFEHLTDIGITLSFEGPAYEPHPTVRAWVKTK